MTSQKLKLKLKFYDAYCMTSKFEINDIEAKYEDFGDKSDMDSENADDRGCGNMKFEIKTSTQEILDKYNITITQYNKIARKLEEGLSFGKCGWCI